MIYPREGGIAWIRNILFGIYFVWANIVDILKTLVMHVRK
jgi:hypothetical protein